MYKIGITGGISSGKTTASNFFKKKGAYIFNADQESKKHLKSSISLQHKLIDSFGSSVTEGNKLSVVKLAKIAFSSKLNQDILNGIMWPEVYILVHNQLIDAEKEGYGIFVLDAAMIFEAKFENLFDTIFLISTQKNIRIERAIKRSNLPLEQIQNRMSLQMKESEKRAKAKHIITNNKTEKDLILKLNKLYDKEIEPYIHSQ